jgi:hypothetical protein
MSSAPRPAPRIARIWRGRTTAAQADAYATYLYEQGIKPWNASPAASSSYARTGKARASS